MGRKGASTPGTIDSAPRIPAIAENSPSRAGQATQSCPPVVRNTCEAGNAPALRELQALARRFSVQNYEAACTGSAGTLPENERTEAIWDRQEWHFDAR